MIEVLQAADAWEFVKDMKHADVYFFDEPTSAPDKERETRIMEILKNLAKKKIVFVITHQACEE